MSKHVWSLNKGRIMETMRHTLRNIWQWLRTLSGDNAYEHYLVHWQQHHHAQETQPLDRKAFYEIEQQHKWSGINRCC